MQHFVPALVAALLASFLTVVVVELVRGRDDELGEAQALTPFDQPALAADESAASDPAPFALSGGDAGPRVRELEMRIATLESRLANLAPSRQPVVTEEMREQAASLSGTEAVDFVLDVLAQKEEADRRQREEERRRRNEERLLAEAGRIADKLGLDGGQRDSLFGVLMEEDARRAAIFETMRQGNFGPESRDLMREQMRGIADWKAQELADSLGADLADQVKAYQDENRRGRGRGGFGGFSGGRGGGGGGRGD